MRLGRTIWHDQASRAYPAATAPVKDVHWAHWGPVLDQGDLGSCTANALSQALNTGPLRDHLVTKQVPLLTEREAVGLYSIATSIDPYVGRWPVEDTGSSGLAVAKAAKKAGLISAYAHAFGVDHTLGALSVGPVIVGVPWYQSMFTPVSGRLVVDPASGVAGGHEVMLFAIDTTRGSVLMLNSWGDTWGQHGAAEITFADLGVLLADGGDCTQLIP